MKISIYATHIYIAYKIISTLVTLENMFLDMLVEKGPLLGRSLLFGKSPRFMKLKIITLDKLDDDILHGKPIVVFMHLTCQIIFYHE